MMAPSMMDTPNMSSSELISGSSALDRRGISTKYST
ncbi:Uncharacterised protein [Bordetella pertussis]|nr:Uncharacterised protein [Bordetella pertussis]CFP60737.1 Uncharacterised protein [Bordetella pertussis]CFU81270.1 Uncharacterised protein [Bordetella pertussis]CPK92332.1 Uncharacterised protein [Bordetella pertussis]CPL67513.1 Uncharacterised protein [Bordetella pertussis]